MQVQQHMQKNSCATPRYHLDTRHIKPTRRQSWAQHFNDTPMRLLFLLVVASMDCLFELLAYLVAAARLPL